MRAWLEMLQVTPMQIYFVGCTSTRYGRDVFFSARLSVYVTTSGSKEVLKFRDVVANVGRAYNKTDGTFTCPQDGFYQFNYGFLSNHAAGIQVYLQVDGSIVVRAFTPKDSIYNSAHASIIVPLKKGQKARLVVVEKGAKIYPAQYTTFSGMKI